MTRSGTATKAASADTPVEQVQQAVEIKEGEIAEEEIEAVDYG